MILLHSPHTDKKLFAEKLTQAVSTTLRHVRTQRSMSQELLARLAQIDRSGYAKLERGEQKISLPQLFKVAQALQCPAATLLKAIEAELHQGMWRRGA